MKMIQREPLTRLVKEIFAAVGAPPEIATVVAESLVDSNLKGVDSHGVLRVPQYLAQIESGWIQPAARPTVKQASATTAMVDGNQGFGIYSLRFALELAMEKAKSSQIAAVGLVGGAHTGRIGWFAEQAASQGVITLISGGGAYGKAAHMSVAPHGGAARTMATNPLTLGFPTGEQAPVVVDMSTSVTAEGKLRFYRDSGRTLPPGWILDKNGQPSTNAADFYAGGMILPVAGHKGYGLAVAAEFLTGILLGEAHELNWLILALDAAAFRTQEEFAQDAATFIHGLKATPPAPGFDVVMVPGEPEAQTAQQRRVAGIPLPDEIWARLQGAADQVGVMAFVV
jgi:LDH2 family malate/lactate/ureidoglycolate dehydrogenase